jgi:transcriptional regulator with GAF, ATPase, and Fis domain
MKRQERDGIVAALKQTGGKIFGPGGAAELLGMKPTTLASRITALKLNPKTGTR